MKPLTKECSASPIRFWLPALLAILGAVNAPNVARAASFTPEGRSSAFTLYGGIGAGYGHVSGREYASSADGSYAQVGGTISYLGSQFVFDSGIHWTRTDLGGATGATREVDLETRSALWDVSVRYRLGSRWQLGPVVGMQFGADTSLAPTVGAESTTWTGGLRTVYEIPLSFPLRLWQQFGTDLSLAERRYWHAIAGIQIGFPMRKPWRTISSQIRVSRAAPVREAVTVVVDPARVFFSTASARLRPEFARALEDAASFLASRPDSYDRIRVIGHADQRGTRQRNLELSTERAISVAKSLNAGGADPARLETMGRGFDELADPRMTPEAWARNRRVEIVFENVSDPDALREKLGPLFASTPQSTLRSQ